MKTRLKKCLLLIFPLIFSLVTAISFFHHHLETTDPDHHHGSCSLCLFTENSSKFVLAGNTNAVLLTLIFAIFLAILLADSNYSQPSFNIFKSRSPPCS